ncbi:peptidase M50 [Nitrincola sp. A-D6]|uniref:HlyD family efflux transporter periplasmic adaptor subunit n=1 Tax=Nitrincola sp. A-D6 TaxID=1545442 RepID=UPI00051FC2E5|nr:HlyD family efflux transporter periplasmic adaptor subunit [Nitrincola sp. A-D6]KGK43282.1 peptidase M50 [Nitrincola sp. A-D6]
MVEARLPTLRQNLKLLPGAHDEDGAPRWLLHDVARNRYFSLVKPALELIRYWQPGTTPTEMSAWLNQKGFEYKPEEIRAFADFLIANHLVLARTEQASDYFHRQKLENKKSVWSWLLHNYLFIRIPLLRPDPLLARVMPHLSWLFTGLVEKLVLLSGLIGLFLIIRQWDSFTGTFLHFFSLEGMLLYAITLVLVKSAHELGHALVSCRLGCRVASMGVAFLVMFPVLYTDTTDAWKLRSRKDRLRIVTAGVRTELYLAMLASFLWGVLPDGTLRSAAFFVATTSWITSLLVNVSPFLRFDGYYAFSDLIGVENLQQRAFALGRWKLRYWLWGIDDPMPEPMTRSKARTLIFYAWFTWVYRFLLFLGIALLVYHFFFKVLGILLFVVEILWFILMPVIKELKVWRERWSDFTFTPIRLLCWAIPVILLLAALLPLTSEVRVPAVIRAENLHYVYAPEAAQIIEVKKTAGDSVAEDAELLQLYAPELENSIQQTQEELNLAELRLSRLASSLEDKAEQDVNRERLGQLQARMARLQARQEALAVKAAIAGSVSNMETLHSGQWVGEGQYLLTLFEPGGFKVEGFLSERSLDLVTESTTGFFISNTGQHPAIPVVIEKIDIGAVSSLAYHELGSMSGGPIAVRQSGERLIPETAHYRLSLRLVESADHEYLGSVREPGMLVLEGQRRSWLWPQLERLIAIMIRESGF